MTEEAKSVELEDSALGIVAGGALPDDSQYLQGETIAAPSDNTGIGGVTRHKDPHRKTPRIPPIPFFPEREPGLLGPND